MHFCYFRFAPHSIHSSAGGALFATNVCHGILVLNPGSNGSLDGDSAQEGAVHGALLLAAGFSNRFGSIKLCAELESGTTVFARTLENLQQAVDDVVVVTRPELAEALIQHCDSLQIFDQAERGMGATLAYGISLVTGWETCLVCLADMPFIAPATYRQINAALHADRIIIPTYGDKPGNPVGFGRQFYPELVTLNGDNGGRRVLQAHPTAVQRLAVDDAAVLHDIDTPEDLAHLQAEYRNES